MRQMNWWRFALWPAAMPIFFVVGGLLSGGGHGSFAPYTLFASWGFLAISTLELLDLDGPVVLVVLAWLVAQLAYWWALIWASRSLVRRKGPRLYLLVPAFHVVGGVLADWVKGSGPMATPRNVHFSYFISLCMVFILFCLDWLLLQEELVGEGAGRAQQRE